MEAARYEMGIRADEARDVLALVNRDAPSVSIEDGWDRVVFVSEDDHARLVGRVDQALAQVRGAVR